MRVSSVLCATARAVQRGAYTRLSPSHIAGFEGILGKEHVRTDDINSFNSDWTQQMHGKSTCVLLPASTEETSEVLKYCYANKLSVVVQGGNTGLVGGATPVHDELVLSIRRIRSHFEVDEHAGMVTADSGFVLEEADNAVREKGLMMPVDLGARGSCLIGGCVGAGAGGIRLLRYGSLHSHLLAATMVDGTGRILHLGGKLRKDNTALHAVHLCIGSEGQLGVITRVSFTCPPRPISIHSAMLGVSKFEDAVKLLTLARRKLGEVLSSFELIDAESMRCVNYNLQLKNVLEGSPNFNILVETHGSHSEHDYEKLLAFLEEALTTQLAHDAIPAQNETERNTMWRLREEAPLACMKDGYIYKYDVTLPHAHFYTLIEECREKLKDRANVYCYGHLGDGNAHLNITTKKEDTWIKNDLSPWVYEWVVAHGGSISAEHGIGQLKRDYRHLGKSAEEAELMQQLKAVFDPAGILCPYKMIPHA